MTSPARDDTQVGRSDWWCCVCANTACDGLDCGVYLPGRAPRRQPAAKSKAEMAEIRGRAWATRRLETSTGNSVGTPEGVNPK